MSDIRTVLITGASAGIGEATALQLAKDGNYRLVLCARRIQKLEALKKRILSDFPNTDIHIFELDVRDKGAVESSISNLPSDYSKIDVLINNAGLSQGLDPIDTGLTDDWDRMIDTNLKGLLYVTHSTLPLMKECKNGQIINIGSIAAKQVYPKGNVYNATKHAVDALSKAMRIDLVEKGIKVSAVHPGMVETEFSEVRFKGDKERAKKVYQDFTPLTGGDIADVISYILKVPEHVNIDDVLVMPKAQANAYVTHKN
ncbi:MAG TPA: SDR family NAD(P)-dependent oxidoreductase [Candidatus Sphingobacterium stercoripullorum]|uniref:SDR family NAD(P)-dependent oxidoreductase n=1 Tax=Candidatus Sphingobacterium stercoripullorum TaxID=2838759 RepID=A0A9D1W7J3_9SPHI|nr:SDR family NAD(P)-dependent oxidoreductase [Candidatus Sphingobacterium stercoripullorum]